MFAAKDNGRSFNAPQPAQVGFDGRVREAAAPMQQGQVYNAQADVNSINNAFNNNNNRQQQEVCHPNQPGW